MEPMTPTEHAAFKNRVLRAMLSNKDKIGVGSDEQVMITWLDLLKTPSIRNSAWPHEALSGDEQRFDG